MLNYNFKESPVLWLHFSIDYASISGNYIRYWSFDTLDNVTLKEGPEPNNFGSLVQGQVEMGVLMNDRTTHNFLYLISFAISIYLLQKLYLFSKGV